MINAAKHAEKMCAAHPVDQKVHKVEKIGDGYTVKSAAGHVRSTHPTKVEAVMAATKHINGD